MDIARGNPPTSTRHTPSPAGRLSQSAVWCILRQNLLYPFHVQPLPGVQQEDKQLRLKFYPWLLRKTVDTPQSLCRGLSTQYTQYICTTCMCGQRRILKILDTFDSSTDLISILGWNCKWLRDLTLRNTGSSRWSAVRPFSLRNVSTFIGFCASTCAQDHVIPTQQFSFPLYNSSAQSAQLA
jgi:hypothetical protein